MPDYAGRRSTTQDLGPSKPGAGPTSPGKQSLVECAYAGIQQRASGPAADPSAVHAAAERGIAAPAARLPHADAIQRLFGRHDISGVQAHTGTEATASANEMGANAYAVGDHVVLGRGDDLHTVAHEAAHVVQQRAGVHLSGGVGQAGDSYEQHADAVADLVVQGKSAESLLDQHAGSGGGGSRAVQRESAYDGLMPAHDNFRDSYQFNGAKTSKFTYHHIIPENKLKLVTAQLAIILAYFKGAGAARGKRAGFDSALGGMMTDAKKNWLTTRVKNTTFQLNKEFSDYRLPVKEDEVRGILESTAEQLDPIFAKFRDLYKERLRAARAQVKSQITDALKGAQFFADAKNRDQGALTTSIGAAIGSHLFDMAVVMPTVMANLATEAAGKKKDALTRGDLRDPIVNGILAIDLDTHFQTQFPPLYVNATTPGKLKKLLQDSALPHDEKDHLEHAVQWNPGNVHRGPESSKRLGPAAGAGFNELVDDGGDDFEKAAANLVSKGHYEALVALNAQIDTFTGIPIVGGVPNDDKVDAAVALVGKMHAVMKMPTTGFREDQWEMHGTTKMRVKQNDDKLRAVGLI
jgi:hypothetical protein